MTEEEQADAALIDATAMLDILIMTHRAGAIPATIAACVAWAVENGGTDLVCGTLSRAVLMAGEAEKVHRAARQ